MNETEHPPSPPSPRRGFWILLAVILFQVGYPVVYGVTFNRTPLIDLTGVAFLILGILALRGFRIPRYLSAAASAAVACLLGFVTLRIASFYTPDRQDALPILLMFPVLPAVGLAACSILLLVPSVGAWQQSLRDRRAAARKAIAPAIIAPAVEVDPGPAQPCPWCAQEVVHRTDEQCSACGRPV
jgi:putative flippase GtrA